MEPEIVTLIVCGILLALTLLAGPSNRPGKPRNIEIIDFGETEDLRSSLHFR